MTCIKVAINITLKLNWLQRCTRTFEEQHLPNFFLILDNLIRFVNFLTILQEVSFGVTMGKELYDIQQERNEQSEADSGLHLRLSISVDMKSVIDLDRKMMTSCILVAHFNLFHH